MSNYLKCKVCGAPCLDDQFGQANPLCPEHEEEHRQREIFMTEGGGLDESTAEELKEEKIRTDAERDILAENQ